MHFQKMYAKPANAGLKKSAVRKDAAAADVAAINAISAKIDNLFAEQDKIRKEAVDASKAGKAESETAIAKAEAAAKTVEALSAELADIRQRLATKVEKSGSKSETLLGILEKSASYAAFAKGESTSFIIKAPLTALNTDGTSNTTLIPAAQGPLQTAMVWTDNFFGRLPKLEMQSAELYQYTKEVLEDVGTVKGSKFVKDGQAGNESKLKFLPAFKQLKEVKTWTEFTARLAASAPSVVNQIQTRLALFLKEKVEQALIAGDGTDDSVTGVLATGEHTVYTPAAGDTALESIRKAKGLAAKTGIPAVDLYLNPDDLTNISLMKDANGNFIISSPVGQGGVPTLWGLNVVENSNIPAGKFLIGNPAMASGRAGDDIVTITSATTHGENFTKGVITLNASMLVQYIGFRPQSWFYGDLVD